MKTSTHLLFVASLALHAAASFAQPAGSAPPNGAPPAPPPEAVAACNGKAVGATASFTGRRGETVTGTCAQLGNVVAVMPAGGPPPGGKPPKND